MSAAVGAEVLESLTPAQQVIKIVNEELCRFDGQAAMHGFIFRLSPLAL